MNPLEQELKNALRRQEPSEDFMRRVMAGIRPATKPEQNWWEAVLRAFRFPALRWATAAALCFSLVVGGLAYRRHRQAVAEGEMARAKVMLALHIASAKLNYTLREVHKADELSKSQDAGSSE